MKRISLGLTILYTVIACLWTAVFGAHIYLMNQPTSAYFVDTITDYDLLFIILHGATMILAIVMAIIYWVRYIKERTAKEEDTV